MKRILKLAICGTLFSLPAFACQETLIEYRLSDKVIFLDGDGKPLRDAAVVVREAFGPSARSTGWGKSVGEVVRRGRTDRNGKFSLKGLHGATYWVTYNDHVKGESFFLIRDGGKKGLLELKLDGYVSSNVCYAVDIEHNTTKPTGWPQPIVTETTH